jgi:hypothetical protein
MAHFINFTLTPLLCTLCLSSALKLYIVDCPYSNSKESECCCWRTLTKHGLRSKMAPWSAICVCILILYFACMKTRKNCYCTCDASKSRSAAKNQSNFAAEKKKKFLMDGT